MRDDAVAVFLFLEGLCILTSGVACRFNALLAGATFVVEAEFALIFFPMDCALPLSLEGDFCAAAFMAKKKSLTVISFGSRLMASADRNFVDDISLVTG